MSGLRGKCVLIVGAGSGIGAAVARRMGERGATVVVHFNSNKSGANAVVDHVRGGGGKAFALQGDVSDARIAAGLVDQTIEIAGDLDIVINNAGDMFGRTRITEATDQQFSDVVDLNIGSVFHTSRRAAQILSAKGAGSIINTTSIAARTGGGDGAGLYGSAKAFVSTITRVMAKELAPFGVRVNAVAPGVISTAFHDRNSTAAQLAASALSIPMGRLGTAEECVGAYEFLADPSMSSYVTGQVIEVNGGQLMP